MNNSFSAGATTLSITDTSASMNNSQTGQLLWSVEPGMFADSVAGTALTLTVTATTVRHTAPTPIPHPPPGPGPHPVIQALPLGLEPETFTSTSTRVTITIADARFAGTTLVADCVMSFVFSSGTGVDGEPFDLASYSFSGTFGGVSASGDLDEFTGYITQPFTQTVMQVATTAQWALALDDGIATTLLVAPGYLALSATTEIGTITAQSNLLPATLSFSSLVLTTLNPNADSDLADPTPLRSQLTFSWPGGWSIPLPGTAVALGTLSAADTPDGQLNYDTASAEIAELSDGSFPFLLVLTRVLTGEPATHSYDLTLLAGVSLLGDATNAPIVLPLVNVILYALMTADQSETRLHGSVGALISPWSTGAFVITPDASGPTSSGSFDFAFDSGQETSCVCMVQTTSISCSVPDAITTPLPTGQAVYLLPAANMPASAAFTPNYIAIGDVATGAVRAYCEGASFSMTRPSDLAVASFSFQYCGPTQPEGAALQFTQTTSGNDPVVTAILPSQHITEQPYDLATGSIGTPPYPARISGPTTLVYKLESLPAAQVVPLPWTAATLLDWTTMDLQLPSAVNELGGTSTIELPYHVFLTPLGPVGFATPEAPTPCAAVAELWHARLGIQHEKADGSGLILSERQGLNLTAHAIGSPDYPAPGTSPFPNEALSPQDRHDIVDEASADTVISIDKLILSAMGATANLSLIWPSGSPPTGDELTAWTQSIGLGRDSYTRAVTTGFLLPWGHAASCITVAQRRFSGDANNTSYLDEKTYIALGETTRSYSAETAGATIPRDAPFPTIEMLTAVTPPVDVPPPSPVPAGGTGDAFWVTSAQQPVLLNARIHDGDSIVPGKTAAASLASIFVPAGRDDLVTAAMTAYNTNTLNAAAVATTSLGGANLAMAISKVAGDTTQAVSSVNFVMRDLRAGQAGAWNLAAGMGNFVPAISQAVLDLPAVRMLTSAATTEGIVANYLPQYLDSADPLGSNPVDGYMQFASVTAGLAGDKANGLVSPALAITGLSRSLGAVAGDVTSLASGAMNLPALLGTGQLLNLIPFTTLIEDAGFDLGQVPVLQLTKTAQSIVANYAWTPTVNTTPTTDPNAPDSPPSWSDPAGFAKLMLNGPLAQSISINSSVTTPISSSLTGVSTQPPVSITTVAVNNFSLQLLDLVQINFASATFAGQTGKKPDVNISLASNAFVLLGQIDFLQVLLEAIEDLFDAGPAIDVDDEAITLTFVFAVPNIGMGYFNLNNISIAVDVVLSLSTNPIEFHFHFAGPDNPFDLAVDLLGGGGYFLIDTSDAENTSITLSAQAGASASLDLGVASGSVSLMLGVTFQSSSAIDVATGTGGPMVTGYFRADGELTVLEILSIHVSTYLGVTYAFETGCLWGEASIEVEVSLLFFHKSVTLTVRKEFPVKLKLPSLAMRAEDGTILPHDAVAGTAPVVINQIMSPADWTSYVQAFAAA